MGYEAGGEVPAVEQQREVKVEKVSGSLARQPIMPGIKAISTKNRIEGSYRCNYTSLSLLLYRDDNQGKQIL